MQRSDIRRTQRGPRDWSVAPSTTIREVSREGFSNVQTPVWGSTILLVHYVCLQIRYLEVHELFGCVKVNTTRYSGFLHTLADSFVDLNERLRFSVPVLAAE
jgi:hypothetical protein